MSRSDLVPLLDAEHNEMDELGPTVQHQEYIRSFIPQANNCSRNVCSGLVCNCENFDVRDLDIEQAPLVSYQSSEPNSSFFTGFHCHTFRPQSLGLEHSHPVFSVIGIREFRTCNVLLPYFEVLQTDFKDSSVFTEMEEPRTELRGPLFPAANCVNGVCGGSGCLCGNGFDGFDELNGAENAPLISYQSGPHNETYFTDVHCHEFRPIFSNKNARRKLTIASIVCLFFVIAEVVGGYLAHSLAIMTDAAHMLSDFAAFLISLFAIWVAKWQPDKKRTFGYYRAEVLGALVSVLIIWVLTGILVYLAVQRVLTRDFEINADIMIITAGVALAINILLGIILHQAGVPHGHSHDGGGSHSHSHSHSFEASINHPHSNSMSPRVRSGSVHEKENINVRAAFIHVLGDVVQSVGVLIAAYIIKYKPTWKLADPICTFLFSILVLITTLNIVRDTIHVLMEGTPKNINYNAVKGVLENIQGVVAAHSLHIWSLTVNKAALAVHLAVAPGTDTQKVLNIAHQKLKTEFQIFHSTIQVELYQESVMTNCDECQDLKD